MTQIIHIGYPKTATTWFQKKMFPNVSNYSFMDRKDVMNLFIKPYGNNFNLDKTRKYIEKTYSKNIIISDERLLGGMYTGGYNGFASKIIAKRLNSVFPDAKIIIFIRNQTDIITSTYYHYIMYGGTYGIKKFLFPPGFYVIQKIGMFSFEFFNYYNMIKLFNDIFSSVDVYLYEDFKTDNKHFIKKFISKYHFDVSIDNISFDKSNSRYRRGLIGLKKFMNLFTNKQLIYKYYICNIPFLFNISLKIFSKLNNYSLFGKHVKSESLLKRRNINYIKNYYKTSNAKLIREFRLNKISKYNY